MNTENTYGMHILVPNHLEDRDDIHYGGPEIRTVG